MFFFLMLYSCSCSSFTFTTFFIFPATKNTERFRESASFFRPRFFFLGPMGSSVSCLEEEDKKDVTWTEFWAVKSSVVHGTMVSEANGMNTRSLDEKKP